MTLPWHPYTRALVEHGLTRSSLRRAVGVAVVVGPTLTLINQFKAIFGAEPFNSIAAVLTFAVPFCVSVFATAQTGMTANSNGADEVSDGPASENVRGKR